MWSRACSGSVARALGVLLACLLTGCEPSPVPAPKPATSSAPVSPATTVHDPTPSPTPSAAPTPSLTPSSDALTSLVGNTRNAIAWASLSDPDTVMVEGSVPRSRAWSTSKVLVIAAYLDQAVHGDPAAIPNEERGWIQKALTMSDGPSILALQNEIDDPGDVMTGILRDIGDTSTTAPDSYVGTMEWSVREQVRFMAALGTGKVVSPQASAFLLDKMKPIASQRWGLASIGARAFKPGWVSGSTETRQMGIVGNFAVAIITAGEGPVTLQSDGDYAHQWQLDRLAALLAERIG